MLLAAPLAKLGRHDEAKAAVSRLIELEPAFRLSTLLAAVDCGPGLAASLTEALQATQIPE